MNIAILGVGGVGGYFGAKICAALSGDGVSFVARGAHLEAIRAQGLTVRTSSEGTITCRPALATDDIGALPMLDAALICVKSYDLAGAAAMLSARLSPGAEVVPLLNGVDVYDRLREHIESAAIFPAAVFIGTHIESPGVVAQEGGACRILYGRDPRRPTAEPRAIRSIFERAGIKSEWYEDVSPAIWTKFVFIAAFGLVTACWDRTLGEVMASAELGGRVRAVMGEAAAVAYAMGVALPQSIVEDSLRKGADFPPETRTSFQRDFENRGKPDERDLFGGTIVRLGERYGVPTPATREIMGRLEKLKLARGKGG